eukprot:1160184-Pelagomonas_calceolata.AAC.9
MDMTRSSAINPLLSEVYVQAVRQAITLNTRVCYLMQIRALLCQSLYPNPNGTHNLQVPHRHPLQPRTCSPLQLIHWSGTSLVRLLPLAGCHHMDSALCIFTREALRLPMPRHTNT